MVENVGKDRLQKSVKHSTAKRLQNDRKTALSEAYANLTRILRLFYDFETRPTPRTFHL